MALPALLSEEEWSALDAHDKKHYRVVDGKYRLEVGQVDGWGLEDAGGLKKVLAETKEERKKLREFKASLGDDFDPEKAKSAMAFQAKAKDWTPTEEAQAKIDAKIREIGEKHQREIAAKAEREKLLLGALNNALIDASASAILANPAVGGSTDLLLPVIRSNTFIEEVDGKFVARVRGEGGVALTTRKEGKIDPMDLGEYISEVLRKDNRYARAFKGTDAEGAGGVDNKGGSGRSSGSAHIISAADARDTRKYRVAKEAAEKAGATLQVDYEARGDS